MPLFLFKKKLQTLDIDAINSQIANSLQLSNEFESYSLSRIHKMS